MIEVFQCENNTVHARRFMDMNSMDPYDFGQDVPLVFYSKQARPEKKALTITSVSLVQVHVTTCNGGRCDLALFSGFLAASEAPVTRMTIS